MNECVLCPKTSTEMNHFKLQYYLVKGRTEPGLIFTPGHTLSPHDTDVASLANVRNMIEQRYPLWIGGTVVC